ncbi:MAG TPA: sigma-70 family RNA polymerase sigma factor [Arenicellales bacterium]|nr:sigma-70 family RNA polymerase sigma factor [Arenicellales bacterium]
MARPGTDKTSRSPQTRNFFEQEVSRLMDRLYGTALRLARNPVDAEDVVAEAVERAWTRLDELRDTSQFEGWMFRILNNTFVDAWRRRKSRQDREATLDETGDDGGGSLEFSLFEQLHQPFLLWWGTPEERVLESLLGEDIERALDELPDEYRLVIILVEVQGYSYQETGELLEIPLGTVRSRLNRARGLLQKSLWQQARDAGIMPIAGSAPDCPD